MLSESIRILNFDDSLIEQNNLIEQFSPEIVDLKRIGPASRLWLSAGAAREVTKALEPAKKNSITFIGSGDFHHISSLLIGQFDEPISIIIFDHHPDWNMLPPSAACGSWVTKILEKRNVKKVILCGISSSDISSLSIYSANLRSLSGNRVEIYPYAHQPTINVFKHVPSNRSIRIKRKWLCRDIYWQGLRGRNLEEFFLNVLSEVETKRVYVSIDKDCLKADYALTNWEEGCFDLSELLLLLRMIKEHMDICGVDIAGDYSAPKLAGWFKTICSLIDHPNNYTAKGQNAASIRSINGQTNIKLLKALIN